MSSIKRENHYKLHIIKKQVFSQLFQYGEVDLGKSALEQVNNNSPVDINNIPQFKKMSNWIYLMIIYVNIMILH